jgi:hypothetical protein
MNSFLKVPLTATCLVATWLAVKVAVVRSNRRE